jgi:hypothetical protein
MSEQQTSLKVPVNSKHRVKVISSSDPEEFEKESNKFLETISDEKLLVSMTFIGLGANLNNIIYYRDISPMTKEDWQIKLETQKKFSKGFIPNDMMPNGEEVSKL